MGTWEADFHYKTAARRPGQNTHTPFLCCFIVFWRGPPVPEGPKCEKGGLRPPRGPQKKVFCKKMVVFWPCCLSVFSSENGANRALPGHFPYKTAAVFILRFFENGGRFLVKCALQDLLFEQV